MWSVDLSMASAGTICALVPKVCTHTRALAPTHTHACTPVGRLGIQIRTLSKSSQGYVGVAGSSNSRGRFLPLAREQMCFFFE